MNERRDEISGGTVETRTNPPAASAPRGLDPSQESAIDRMILRESAGDGAQAPPDAASPDAPGAHASDASDARGPATTDEPVAAVAPDAGGTAQAATASARAPTGARHDEQPVQLFADADTARYRERWREIQVGFVDDPRTAVDRADELVVTVLEDVRRTFAEQRGGLVRAWEAGDHVSTEDLRITLRQYRSFFQRLLSL